MLRGYPKRITLNRGAGARSTQLNPGAYADSIEVELLRPDKPIQDAEMKSHDGWMRAELLDQRWVRSIAKARDTVDAYREGFSEVRPHSTLDGRTPGEYARRYYSSRNSQRFTL